MRKRLFEKKGILFKIIIIILSLFTLFVLAFFLSNTSIIERYKRNIKETYYSFINRNTGTNIDNGTLYENIPLKELQRRSPLHVPIPQWMPDGYTFVSAQYLSCDNYEYIFDYQYKNIEQNRTINFQMNSIPFQSMNIYVDFDEIQIDGINVIIMILELYDGTTEYSTMYVNNQGLFTTIGDLKDKETLIKIIENMN